MRGKTRGEALSPLPPWHEPLESFDALTPPPPQIVNPTDLVILSRRWLLLLIEMFPSQAENQMSCYPLSCYCVHAVDAPLHPPSNPDGVPYTIMDKAIIDDEMDDEGHSQILVNLCPVLVFPSQASLDRVSDFRISTVKCHSGRFITPSTFQPLSQFLLR